MGHPARRTQAGVASLGCDGSRGGSRADHRDRRGAGARRSPRQLARRSPLGGDHDAKSSPPDHHGGRPHYYVSNRAITGHLQASATTVLPTAAPPGVTWSLFQGVALASSHNDGPTRVNAPIYAGYSHTPTGALLALNQLSVRYLITPGSGWRSVVSQQVLPGPGRDSYEINRAKVTSLAGAKFGQTAGFRFVTYSPTVAVIQLATSFPTHYQVATCTVRWSDGDWKLELQPDGGVSPTAQQVPNLAGFTAWSGVS